jgi:hypothetical protein
MLAVFCWFFAKKWPLENRLFTVIYLYVYIQSMNWEDLHGIAWCLNPI